MPRTPPRRSLQRLQFLGGAALVLSLLAIAALLLPGGPGAEPEPSSVGEREPTPSPSPTPPPAPLPPYSVEDEATLTLPEELRAAKDSFYLEAGQAYLATFEVSTVKPESEPGHGMYLGITFSCGGANSGRSEWIGGTENLLRGEPVVFRNQMLLTVTENDVITCSVRANAPYDDVAAEGATVKLDIRWSVRPVGSESLSTPSEARLPKTVVPGTRAVAFSQVVQAADLPDRRVQLLMSLHLTTCTGANGSREHGRAWCVDDDIHEGGSDFDTELRVDVLDRTGTVCDSLDVASSAHSLSLERHHHLLSRKEGISIPVSLCGPSLRVSVVVENRGPASLVVHQANSSLITVAA